MSDSYRKWRELYEDVSGSTVLAAGDDLSTNARELVALKLKETIFVQRISINVITDNAATQTFQDDAGTPVVIAKTKASPGIGPILFEFGDKGRALTEGKAFQMKNSAAGLAADVTWHAYRRRTGAGVPNP